MKSAVVSRLVILSALVILPQVCAGAEPATVLDETCCLRRYYRFGDDLVSPAAMKAEGQKILGDVLYDRIRKDTEKSIAVAGNDTFAVFRPSLLSLKEARRIGTTETLKNAKPAAGTNDWREVVFRRMFFDPYTAPPPPDAWAAPAFDDASWVSGLGPFQSNMPNDLPPEV